MFKYNIFLYFVVDKDLWVKMPYIIFSTCTISKVVRNPFVV